MRFGPKLGFAVKVRAFEKKDEMDISSTHVKGEWNQYFVTLAGRLYPLVLHRLSPYADLGLVYSNVTETTETIHPDGHFLFSYSSGGFGVGAAGGIELRLTPDISLFGEVEYTRVKTKGALDIPGVTPGLDIAYDISGPFFGGGILFSF